ncbi:MAG: toprim domain-containing protein [Candidatus Shikimatogenerans sp. Tcar]|uniref:DNA gyrase subunit B n=1 Tax=Candidatus Shikimatogenerans sp. Tcar TaxID=3158565 RepID=A0AAU7QRZ7_9FLAO
MLSTYNSQNIKYLNDIKHIRLRPSMYIGNVNKEGLHHLIHEIINNSVDEHTTGYGKIININIYKNKYIKIKDEGRGIPTGYNKKYKKFILELILTKLGTGGKFNNKSYKMSGGLHGVGLSCVNALSKKFIIKIFKKKYTYIQIYKRGKKKTNLKIYKNKNKKKGTQIIFKPDKKIFKKIIYNKKYINNYIKEISLLNKNLIIIFNNKKIFNKKGLKKYFKYKNKNKMLNNKYIYIKKDIKNKIYIEIFFFYSKKFKNKFISYVNNIKTIDGGTHVLGFKKGIYKTFNKYLNNNINYKNKNIKITNKYYLLGLNSIINIKINNPKFEGQTKNKLTNIKIINIIKNLIFKKFFIYLKYNNNFYKKIINKFLLYNNYIKEIKKSKDLIYKKKQFLNNNLPNKLSDCLFNKNYESELYLVEGDSAGGTAKQGRNREYQAILPLKGKIINSEKSVQNKVFDNNEIKNIFLSLGIFYKKKKLNIKKIRYKKIIIMTDADIDGKHITTLILTFFIKYLKDIIKKKYLYIVYPPLYLLKYKKKYIYIWNKKDKNNILKKYKNKKIYIQRYKGLGEMNSKQLWQTTMNPKNRILKNIIIKNKKKTKKLFNILMGNNSLLRKKFIKKYSKLANINI